jgi:energy-coupling factor transporter ATP-binding protein EcfA2
MSRKRIRQTKVFDESEDEESGSERGTGSGSVGGSVGGLDEEVVMGELGGGEAEVGIDAESAEQSEPEAEQGEAESGEAEQGEGEADVGEAESGGEVEQGEGGESDSYAGLGVMARVGAAESDEEEEEEVGVGGGVSEHVHVTEDDLDNMPPDQLLMLFDRLYEQLVSVAPRIPSRFGKFALEQLIGEETMESVNLVSLRQTYMQSAAAFNDLVGRMNQYGMTKGLVEGIDARDLNLRIQHYRLFLGQLYSAACACVGCAVRRSSTDAKLSFEDEDAVKYPFLNTGEAQRREFKPTARLIYFFLSQAFTHNLRRANGMVYEQKYFGSTPTHAWVPKYSMSDFIHDMARKETHTDVWDMLHGEASKVISVENYLSKCRDSEFPTIKRERRYMSFMNGLYDIYEDRFYRYGDPHLTTEIVSCNFHEKELKVVWFDDPRYVQNPNLIQTPNLDRILRQQGFEIGSDVYRWILAWALGRPQYDMGIVERHHRNGVFLLGHAGSGKSTLAKIVEAMYADEDTGHLNSECEPKYALAQLVGKYVWFCLEVKKNFQLDMGMLLQMLEGRARMAIQKKNVTAWTEEWNIPGLLAGNEIPTKWIEGGAGNSLVRRMFIIEFPNKPPKLDPMLNARLMHELPAIMVKSNRMYRMIAEAIGPDGDIDEAMPAYFKETLARFQAKTQPFVYMLVHHPELVRDPLAKMSLVDLKHIYTQWSKANGHRQTILDDDEITRQIKSQGFEILVVKKAQPIEYNGKRMAGTFIVGLCLRSESSEANVGVAGSGSGAGVGAGAGIGAGVAGSGGMVSGSRSVTASDIFV